VFLRRCPSYRNLQSNILQFVIDCQEKNAYAFCMTWNLVSQSFRLLRSDKKLLVFPVLSAIGAAALALPLLSAVFGMRPGRGFQWGPDTWLFFFLWYWGASFITIFFNCALAACVQMRFAGQDPTLADGLRRAASRVDTILMWSLVSATVGQIARAMEERAGWIGRLIIGTVGLGWGMATYLVIPVLVMEDAGVMDSVRRSSSLLRQTWGEQLISGIAFGWLGLLVAIPGVVLGVVGANGHPLFIVPAIAWFATMAAAFTAAREIFTVALYRYATTGEPPNGYDAATLGTALRPR
jgi:uncharacterized protein DUF6159